LPCITELSSWRDFRATESARCLFIYSSNPDDLISLALGAPPSKILNRADYSLKKYYSHHLSRSRVPISYPYVLRKTRQKMDMPLNGEESNARFCCSIEHTSSSLMEHAVNHFLVSPPFIMLPPGWTSASKALISSDLPITATKSPVAKR